MTDFDADEAIYEAYSQRFDPDAEIWLDIPLIRMNADHSVEVVRGTVPEFVLRSGQAEDIGDGQPMQPDVIHGLFSNDDLVLTVLVPAGETFIDPRIAYISRFDAAGSPLPKTLEEYSRRMRDELAAVNRGLRAGWTMIARRSTGVLIARPDAVPPSSGTGSA